MGLSTFTVFTLSQLSSSRTFSSPQKKAPLSMATTNLLCVSIDFPILDISCTQNHAKDVTFDICSSDPHFTLLQNRVPLSRTTLAPHVLARWSALE